GGRASRRPRRFGRRRSGCRRPGSRPEALSRWTDRDTGESSLRVPALRAHRRWVRAQPGRPAPARLEPRVRGALRVRGPAATHSTTETLASISESIPWAVLPPSRTSMRKACQTSGNLALGTLFAPFVLRSRHLAGRKMEGDHEEG